MADDKVDIIEDTVRDLVSMANTTWDDINDAFYEEPGDNPMNLEPILVVQALFVAKFKTIFKAARQDAYNLGLQDAALLIDWEKLWNDIDTVEIMSHSAQDYVTLFKQKLKELFLAQMKENSK